MEKQIKKFSKDFFIYGIGDFSSKMIVFLLLPLYSRELSQAEFGVLELILATQTFITPILLFQITASVYRFLIDRPSDVTTVFTTSFIFLLVSLLFFGTVFFFINNYFEFNLLHLNLIVCLYFINVVQMFFKEVARGLGRTSLYSSAGVVKTIVSGSLTFILLLYFNYKYEGIIIALIGGNLISLIQIVYKLKPRQFFNARKFSIPTLKSLLTFSSPLIPNAIMWWFLSLSDRYMIDLFLDKSSLGIYSMAARVASVLIIINTVIQQSWQGVAIKSYSSKNRDKLYSETFNLLLGLELVIVYIGTIFSKSFVSVFLGDEYFLSWYHIPILLTASMFHFMGTFYGIGYWVSKNMSGALYTSLIAGVINVALNLVLLNKLGIFAASLSTLISYSLMWVLRVKTTKKYFTIKTNYFKLLLALLIIAGCYYLNFQELNIALASIFAIGFIIILVLYKESFNNLKALILNQ